jgi:hypothetical protein
LLPLTVQVGPACSACVPRRGLPTRPPLLALSLQAPCRSAPAVCLSSQRAVVRRCTRPGRCLQKALRTRCCWQALLRPRRRAPRAARRRVPSVACVRARRAAPPPRCTARWPRPARCGHSWCRRSWLRRVRGCAHPPPPVCAAYEHASDCMRRAAHAAAGVRSAPARSAAHANRRAVAHGNIRLRFRAGAARLAALHARFRRL